MRGWGSRLGVTAAIFVALLALVWWLVGGIAGVVASRLPDFPDWPPPVQVLEAESVGEIYFSSWSPYDFDILLNARPLPVPTTGRGTLLLPDGASAQDPVPAVVLLHGSGGISPGREREAARTLAEAGYAAFVIDYYAPRGIGPESDYMAKVLAVTEFDAVADAYGALRVLSTHPAIDGDRVGLMGFSYGGMAVRIAMDERARRALAPDHPGFRSFVDVYGPCFQDWGTRETNGSPLLTLRGTRDASNDLAACAEREEGLRRLGVEVEAKIYEGAGHAWEVEKPRALEPSPYVAGCTVRYDERGHSFVSDTPIVSGEPDDTRAERVLQRIASGRPMTECVHEGYVIGRDDETRARASRDWLDYLARTLADGRV
jgi:dienelactone hydrolase